MLIAVLVLSGFAGMVQQQPAFKGDIKVDVRDSQSRLGPKDSQESTRRFSGTF